VPGNEINNDSDRSVSARNSTVSNKSCTLDALPSKLTDTEVMINTDTENDYCSHFWVFLNPNAQQL